jgi:Sulfotransferase family
MVISDAPPLLFVHIPKTAGVSVAHALRQEAKAEHRLCRQDTKHETAAAFIDRVGVDVFRSYHSFAVVRHPLDRFISHYRYLKTHPDEFPEMDQIVSPDAYAEAIECGDGLTIRKPERVMSQGAFVMFDGAICVNQIIRFEKLTAEFNALCARTGIGARTLVPMNQSVFAASAPSPTVRQFVESYYADDFRLFGY